MKGRIISLIILSLCCFLAKSQEGFFSHTYSYLELLALDGDADRTFSTYKTLSDSKWVVNDIKNDSWTNSIINLNDRRKGSIIVYGPELYTSYNSATPYGQNDGLLWQGRGFNAYLTGGLRYEHKGFALTFKPDISFSSNQKFAIIPPEIAFTSNTYIGKAQDYGYYGVRFVDAPQRFGNKSFIDFGLGDSEIRYSSKAFTVGLGTQYLWLGPAKINPIIHSNNAPSYPRFDIGVKPTSIKIKGIDFGKIEARWYLGQLTESKYFDTIQSNNYRLLSGMMVAYSPSFLKGFTVFANRNFLCPWVWKSLFSVGDLFYIPGNIHGGRDVWDQRASVGFNYLLPSAGFEVYTEIGLNDYSPGLDGYIRYPFHSMVYTSGMRKSVSFELFKQPIKGELLLEVSNLEMSQDFQFQWSSTFYAHHEIKQGYTNRGQWLGAGNGTGGNSQYLGFKMFHPKGNVNVYVHRKNPDNDYIYQYSINTDNKNDEIASKIMHFKAVVASGISSTYFVKPNIILFGGICYYVEHNPLYNSKSWSETSKVPSVRLEAGVKININ
ncbi:hypothetical protein MASR2M117_16550 [Paludibacter sp.]